ncbi:MAG: hypothetical protein COB51_06940 [Moraxellaceae bacterium]|nr:MAG: hypothetical protein COB51_06940 [Moraxellaceae bacterium]
MLFSVPGWAVYALLEGIPESEYQAFVAYTKLAPGNLSKDRETFSQLSDAQIKDLVESFNVSHFGFLHPVKIPGSQLPSVLHRKMAHLSVMAVWDGSLKPIPFQFDEYDNKSHYIYIPGINTNDIDGVYGELDLTDDLIFMLRNASENRYIEETMGLEEGTILKEIKLTDRQGRDRYVYLIEHNSQRSEVDYVRYISSKDNSKIDTTFINLDFNPENFFDFRNLSNNYGSDAHHPVMDQNVLQISANIFNKYITINLDAFDNIQVKVLGVKDGPVRATIYTKIYFVLAGIPLFGMNSEVSFYEQGLSFPNRTEVGKGVSFANLIKNPKIKFYSDLNIDGGIITSQSFINSEGKRMYTNVDGKVDAEEKEIQGVNMPGNWIWIQHGGGWEVVAIFKLADIAFEGMSSHIFYDDDKSILTANEKFPGASPHIGLLMEGLPTNMEGLETLEMEYVFWFADTVGDEGPLEFYLDEKHPLDIDVTNIDSINRPSQTDSLVFR